MLSGSREDICNLINTTGATLYDLAAQSESTPEDIAKQLSSLSIPLPSMNLDGPFDFIKGLHRNTLESCTAEELLADATGSMQNYPKNSLGSYTGNKSILYKHIHGFYVDRYNGETVTEKDLHIIDGNPENFLITNIEALSMSSWDTRFNHSIGLVSEIFEFDTKHFDIKIEIRKKYDQLIGGTYNPSYVEKLFHTWVQYPLDTYFKRNVEEAVMFKHRTPMYISWWTWTQLSLYGLLKGLKSVQVTPKKHSSMKHTANLSDQDVLNAVRSVIIVSQAKALQGR